MSTAPLAPPVRDLFGRALRNLRLSVTDRCNLRCHYCMPEREYKWLPKQDRLSFEELTRLVQLMAPLGVHSVRLTGGEPLLRRELPVLVKALVRVPGIEEVTLTTNAVLLNEQAQALADAGLSRMTVSLDTLDPDRFKALTGQARLPQTLAGIAAATEAGFGPIKLNTVVTRGTNDDEIETLFAFAKETGHELRYIEYMDVGGALHWQSDKVVSKEEILERIAARFGPVGPAETPESAPATRFQLEDGTTFGIIASTTQPFCATCTRARITADGLLYTCLYGTDGLDLRARLRAGDSDSQLIQQLTQGWQARKDRGAEERLADPARGASVDKDRLQTDPHLEMHTKGG